MVVALAAAVPVAVVVAAEAVEAAEAVAAAEAVQAKVHFMVKRVTIGQTGKWNGVSVKSSMVSEEGQSVNQEGAMRKETD